MQNTEVVAGLKNKNNGVGQKLVRGKGKGKKLHYIGVKRLKTQFLLVINTIIKL